MITSGFDAAKKLGERQRLSLSKSEAAVFGFFERLYDIIIGGSVAWIRIADNAVLQTVVKSMGPFANSTDHGHAVTPVDLAAQGNINMRQIGEFAQAHGFYRFGNYFAPNVIALIEQVDDTLMLQVNDDLGEQISRHCEGSGYMFTKQRPNKNNNIFEIKGGRRSIRERLAAA